MATYTIVSATQSPLDPGEINAGQNVTVNPGDVFVFGPGADADVNFFAASGGPHDFDIVFNDSLGLLKVKVYSDLKPTVTIADNVDLGTVDIDAIASDGLTLTAGDNATLRKLDGSDGGDDNITLGNNFTATGDWNTTGGEDVITAGDNVTFQILKTGIGNDTVAMNDGASFNIIDGGAGNDSIWMDDDATGHKITGFTGDDYIRTGTNANIAIINGESGTTDVYETQDPSSVANASHFETVTVICFRDGTAIRTIDGPRPVQTLAAGDRVWTADRGYQPLRWVGGYRVDQDAQTTNPRVRPVCIRVGALGPNLPSRDLYVSQQHRILLRSPIVERVFGVPEVLVPAKKLLGVPGIALTGPGPGFTYHHLVFDRHEVVEAEGVQTESMLLAPQALKTLDHLGELAAGSVLAEIAAPQGCSDYARAISCHRSEIDMVVSRSLKNRKSLQNPPTGTVSPPGLAIRRDRRRADGRFKSPDRRLRRHVAVNVN